MLRQYYYKNGKDVTEHFSYEGCIVMCIESFLKQVPTKLIVETLEPVVLYMFPRDMLFKLAKENWEINMFYQKILEYSLIVSQIKADSWRFESARERYNLLLETHPEIIKRDGWNQQGILVVAAGDSRLTWPERELVKQLGEKLYGKQQATRQT